MIKKKVKLFEFYSIYEKRPKDGARCLVIRTDRKMANASFHDGEGFLDEDGEKIRVRFWAYASFDKMTLKR